MSSCSGWIPFGGQNWTGDIKMGVLPVLQCSVTGYWVVMRGYCFRYQLICQSLHPMGSQEEEGRAWFGGAWQPWHSMVIHGLCLLDAMSGSEQHGSRSSALSPPGATCPGRCQAEKAPGGFGRWITWRVFADLLSITTPQVKPSAKPVASPAVKWLNPVHSPRQLNPAQIQGWTSVLFHWFSR